MRYSLTKMKTKIRLVFDYPRKKDGFDFTALDPDTLNIKVFLKDGTEFKTDEIELVTFNVKKERLDTEVEKNE